MNSARQTGDFRLQLTPSAASSPAAALLRAYCLPSSSAETAIVFWRVGSLTCAKRAYSTPSTVLLKTAATFHAPIRAGELPIK